MKTLISYASSICIDLVYVTWADLDNCTIDLSLYVSSLLTVTWLSVISIKYSFKSRTYRLRRCFLCLHCLFTFFQTNKYTSSTIRSTKISSRISCIPSNNATHFSYKITIMTLSIVPFVTHTKLCHFNNGVVVYMIVILNLDQHRKLFCSNHSLIKNTL